MNGQGQEFVEIFLQEASERLQFLREYSGILQDAYPRAEDVERLHIAAHTLAGTSASYGFPLFSEISGKLAHIFQYAMNASIAADAAAPLVEFISEAVALLESDLIMISTNAIESEEDIGVVQTALSVCFPVRSGCGAGAGSAPAELRRLRSAVISGAEDTAAGIAAVPVKEPAPEPLPQDGEVPAEVLEFFVPEAEEHLQVVTHCLLSLETNPSSEQIHRLLRAMHTIKGSAAQVGLHRISHVAHRAEDLIGRLREGELRPSAEIIDICLDAVDTLKKFLYHQWADEAAHAVFGSGIVYAHLAAGAGRERAGKRSRHCGDGACSGAANAVRCKLPAGDSSGGRAVALAEPAALASDVSAVSDPAALPPVAVAETKKPEDKLRSWTSWPKKNSCAKSRRRCHSPSPCALRWSGWTA